MASNDCITDTTRYSVRRAGLLFGIKFELNGNHLSSLCDTMPNSPKKTKGTNRQDMKKLLEKIIRRHSVYNILACDKL